MIWWMIRRMIWWMIWRMICWMIWRMIWWSSEHWSEKTVLCKQNLREILQNILNEMLCENKNRFTQDYWMVRFLELVAYSCFDRKRQNCQRVAQKNPKKRKILRVRS